MKKMKKLFTMLLSVAMLMGLSVTAFAYESVDIPINGAGTGATFAALQMIEPDTTTDTGWKFSTSDIQADFTEALGVSDAQTALWMLIGNKDSSIVLPGGVTAATDGQIAAALENVKAGHTFSGHTATVSASNAGVYYIDGVEEGFVYSPMAAYVSFGYNESEVPVSLSCAGVVAKRATTVVTKDATSVENADEITEINRVETYTVESVVPFLPLTDSNRQYWAKDSIRGAVYNVIENEEDANNGKLPVSVKVGDAAAVTYYATVADSGFALDLSDLLAGNANANKAIVLSYQATVKDVVVHNDIKLGDGKNDGRFGQDSEDLYTGKITLTKYDEDESDALAGATFKAYKKDANDVMTWATFDANNKFEAWVANEADATPLVTGDNGTFTVSGLDSGTYYFKEVIAPDGYSINEEDAEATLALAEGVEVATAELEAATKMLDTKLSALPATGGIGTTIFTIAGCLIMIAAVVMFTVNRKRTSK